MHALAIALILLSAVTHVFWNYQVKRSPAPAVYAWWLLALGALLFAPLAVWLAWPVSIPAAGWYCVAGTALLYGGYFSLIALSYRREDLSRAYPIARGVAPLATAAWGVLFHHEHPTTAGWLGIAAISLGVFALAWPSLTATDDRRPTRRLNRMYRMIRIRKEGSGRSGPSISPSLYPNHPVHPVKSSGRSSVVGRRSSFVGFLAAVGTGLCTSGYAAVDKEGVQHVHPALYIVLTFAAGALVLGALLWPSRGWPAFAAEARRGGRGLLLAAALSVGGYLLILEVLRTEPVSYVVPLRSVSVLLSVLTGTHLLGEGGGTGRLAAAALIMLGITAIALGG